jgi:hypothetical protein
MFFLAALQLLRTSKPVDLLPRVPSPATHYVVFMPAVPSPAKNNVPYVSYTIVASYECEHRPNVGVGRVRLACSIGI